MMAAPALELSKKKGTACAEPADRAAASLNRDGGIVCAGGFQEVNGTSETKILARNALGCENRIIRTTRVIKGNGGKIVGIGWPGSNAGLTRAGTAFKEKGGRLVAEHHWFAKEIDRDWTCDGGVIGHIDVGHVAEYELLLDAGVVHNPRPVDGRETGRVIRDCIGARARVEHDAID